MRQRRPVIPSAHRPGRTPPRTHCTATPLQRIRLPATPPAPGDAQRSWRSAWPPSLVPPKWRLRPLLLPQADPHPHDEHQCPTAQEASSERRNQPHHEPLFHSILLPQPAAGRTAPTKRTGDELSGATSRPAVNPPGLPATTDRSWIGSLCPPRPVRRPVGRTTRHERGSLSSTSILESTAPNQVGREYYSPIPIDRDPNEKSPGMRWPVGPGAAAGPGGPRPPRRRRAGGRPGGWVARVCYYL